MPDSTVTGALPTDRRFFDTLLAADAQGLADLLSNDFVLIDVMQGGEIPGPALVEALRSRQITFEGIDVVESRERRHGDLSIVTGQTWMRGRAGDQAWAVRSRYTHVYVRQHERWRLVSAQGTQIAGEPSSVASRLARAGVHRRLR
jgi:ketosteroid isomerase-like protein